MNRRYDFLEQENVFEALNQVRDALLAAHDGNDVDEIMNGILTYDERVKVGRRIQVAHCLLSGMSMRETKDLLKVGSGTVQHVANRLDKYRKCFELIKERRQRIEKIFKEKAYKMVGGSQKVFKTKEYTGFKRKNVAR